MPEQTIDRQHPVDGRAGCAGSNLYRRWLQTLVVAVTGRGRPGGALVNDSSFEANKAYPNRIFLGAEIPALDPELSLKEVNRVAGHPAVKGLALPLSMLNKDYVFDPAFEPVLARARSSATRCYSTRWT
jgi:hypothetical protein